LGFISANRKTSEGNNYGIEAYLAGRKDVPAYSDFYSNVMMGVLGKLEFKHRVRNYPIDMEIGTVSDEALGLLIVENYYDRWVDMYNKSNGMIRVLSAGEQMPKNWMSDILTKYTAGANDGNRQKGKKVKTGDQDDSWNRKWSSAGIVRFNELRQFAKQDRKDHPSFVATWMVAEKAKMKVSTRSDNVFEEPERVVEADNDLDSVDGDVGGGRGYLDKAKNDCGIESDSSQTTSVETER